MEKNNEVNNKIVQTFSEDIVEAIGEGKGELIKKIIHGEEEHEKEKMNLSPESKINKLSLVVSFLLILISIAMFYFFISSQNASTVPVGRQYTPLIFNDKNTFFEIKDFAKEKIEQTILNETRKTEVKKGGVKGIYLTIDKKIVGLREFLALLKSSFTPNEFVEDNFLLGVVNKEGDPALSGEGGDFFMLIKTRSLPDIFPVLRAWENKIFFDMRGFFGIEVSPLTKDFLTRDFEDGIIQNKNARILFDNDKKILMMYIFADDNSVIITNTEFAAREVILRLASSKVKK